MLGSRRLENLFHADARQASARGLASVSIGSFGKGHHTPEKVLTAEDPFTHANQATSHEVARYFSDQSAVVSLFDDDPRHGYDDDNGYARQEQTYDSRFRSCSHVFHKLLLATRDRGYLNI